MSSLLRSTLISITATACLGWPVMAAAQQGWSGTVTYLSSDPSYGPAGGPSLAVDAAGNAIAAWSQRRAYPSAVSLVRVAHFKAASRTWSPPVDIGQGGGPDVVMDAASNAIVVWTGRVDDQSFLFAARFAAITGTWSAPATLAVSDQRIYSVEVFVDATGNATAVWNTHKDTWSPGEVPGEVHAARYTASTDAWATSLLAPMGPDPPASGMDAAGNVTVVWSIGTEGSSMKVQARRYTASTGTWGAVTDLSAAAAYLQHGPIAVDAEGNVTAIWALGPVKSQPQGVQAVRYSAAGAAWGAPVDLGTSAWGDNSLSVKGNPAGNVLALWANRHTSEYVAAAGTWSPVTDLPATASYVSWDIDAQGNAIAVWAAWFAPDGGAVQSSHYSPAAGTWSDAVNVAAFTTSMGSGPSLAVDASGNALAFWTRRIGFYDEGLHAARWSASTGTWGLDVDLSRVGLLTGLDIEFDAAGNAMVGGGSCEPEALGCDGKTGSSWVMQWLATPAAPAIADVGIGDGSLSVVFVPPATIDPVLAPTNYEYSIDDGATWTARVPASTASPLVISPLTSGLLYGVRLRAVNVAGGGVPSARAWSAPGPAPGPPVSVTATIAGDTVTLEWTAPDYTLPPAGYVVEGGLQPGAVAASVATGSTLPQFTFQAPADMFYVRVRAVAGAERSGPSREIRVYVFTPGPPGDPTATVSGRSVTMSWTTPVNSVAATSYVIEGGLHPGEVLASFISPGIGTRFSFPAPAGTYSLRVHAVNGARRGPASNELTVTVPPTLPPAPSNLLGLVNGSALRLSWLIPPWDGLPDGVILTATGALTTTFTLPVSEAFAFDGVPPGTYTFMVAAFNAAGQSAYSNAVTLTFPGPCSGVPAVPNNFQATRSGNVITAAWDLPLTGPAVTGYTVMVGGQYVGTFATTAQSISGVAASGTYEISVAATNPCGAGPPTAPETVIVP